MSKIKLGLFGGSGRMGQSIEALATGTQFSKSIEAYLFVGRQSSKKFSISVENIKNIEDSVLADVDVWIDFSSIKGLLELLDRTRKFKTDVVSGTTGFSAAELESFKQHAKYRKIFWASNMSPGLWAFRQALKGLASASSFDFAIEEVHHTQKKDKPSGTAKTLHQDLENILNKKIETPSSFRLGGVFGVHTVIAASQNEVLTFQHQALNRDVFAEGALMAAKWIKKVKKPGFYSMDNMLSK